MVVGIHKEEVHGEEFVGRAFVRAYKRVELSNIMCSAAIGYSWWPGWFVCARTDM